jgi:ParB family chromosome partitioning protein
VSAKPPIGLGKGFDMLMPQGLDTSLLDKPKDRVQNVFTSDITPNPDQPRRTFDDQALNELAGSIKQYGVLQPLLVVPAKQPGKYVLIAGERRLRASKIAKLDKVPVVVRTVKELEQLEIALVENIQRVDLSPLEQAASIRRLHELFNMNMEDIAKRLGKAVSTVSNILRLLQLPPAAQEALQNNKITEGHARSILALSDFVKQQEQLLLLIIQNGWSVRQAEQYVVATKSGAMSVKKAKKRTAQTTPQTKTLSQILDRPVSVNHMAKGGRLVIRFDTDDDLNELITLLSSIKK